MSITLHGAPEIATSIDHQPATITDRLRGEKERLEKRLAQVNEALTSIESNPGLQSALDSISKLGHI